MEETTFIYALINPVTNQVRYIGKSNNPDRRYREHLKGNLHEGRYKRNWIKGLLKKGVLPDLLILDEVPEKDWRFWELYYYNLYTSWGFELINVAICGEGGHHKGCHNEETIEKLRRIGYKYVRFKDGRRRTDKEIEELIELKKNYIKPIIPRKIYQIDIASNSIVNIHNSTKDCYEALGISKKRFQEFLAGYRIVSKGVKKVLHQWKGYKFVREADYNPDTIYTIPPRSKRGKYKKF